MGSYYHPLALSQTSFGSAHHRFLPWSEAMRHRFSPGSTLFAHFQLAPTKVLSVNIRLRL
jgi:hypothetical protein